MINAKTLPNSDITNVLYEPQNYSAVDESLTEHLKAIDSALALPASGLPPLEVYAGSKYTVPTNTQVLYLIPIKIDGEIVVNGNLIKI